ncbi:MAG TPA: RNA polymerase sigma factor SigJ [Candidatus Nesterenkonia stercoripullorum]|uniref:RNA polymerase sigma factor SigJ n=1 Tax=Candidatus Nesterenkonia stercoripullorum TaxID=2838701 RepID=A0A9D1S226_9MICC|nr:RNA polymerase sigma factor SigJ [Candidatus Nesterenkonia stercoripullorum]
MDEPTPNPKDQRCSPDHLRAFTEHRAALFGAAYRVLGAVQDSEDAVQEAWLRWQKVDIAEVQSPRSYLLRIVSRTALNSLRTQQRRREDYPGPWLPEPISTDVDREPDQAAEIADDVSLALLVVLEALSPLERAAFVLREVFDLSYLEVADALDRSEDAVRKLVSRARSHVHQTPTHEAGAAATHRKLTEKLLEVSRGELPLEDFVSVLAPDVVLTTDAGGRAKAARNPIFGVEKVMRFTAGVLSTPEVAELSWELGTVNGRAAVIGHLSGTIDTVAWIEVDRGSVTRIDMIRNPSKLRAIIAQT